MSSRRSQRVPARLEIARQSFEHWRSHREGRSRIPQQLWRTAVELAEEFGVHRTAKALRLNYEALKSRMKGAPPGPSPSDGPAEFVEVVTGTLALGGPCTVELADGHGARMHIHLEHADAALLAQLTSAFVRGGR